MKTIVLAVCRICGADFTPNSDDLVCERCRPSARSQLLQDLRARWERANEYAEEAQAAGDADRLERAVYRVFLRQIQVSYLEAMPAAARCPTCEPPVGSWTPAELWATERPLWMCLRYGDSRDHSYDALAGDAQDQLDIWNGATA